MENPSGGQGHAQPPPRPILANDGAREDSGKQAWHCSVGASVKAWLCTAWP